jgi:hypothetical protein
MDCVVAVIILLVLMLLFRAAPGNISVTSPAFLITAALIAAFALGWIFGRGNQNGLRVAGDHEAVFINNTAPGVNFTPSNVNTISIQTTDPDRDTAVRGIGDDGYEDFAFGRGNSGPLQTGPEDPWGLYTFMSTSPGYDPVTGMPHRKSPGGLALIWEGYYNQILQFYRRMEVQPDGSVNFEYPRTYHGRGQDQSPQFSLNAPSETGQTQATLSDYNQGPAGGAHFVVKNDANHTLRLDLSGSGFSQRDNPASADTAIMKTDAPGGLVISAGGSRAGVSIVGSLHIPTGGTFTLSAGTANVSNPAVTANSCIILTIATTPSGAMNSPPYVRAKAPGVGFTVVGETTDNSAYSYVVLESKQ